MARRSGKGLALVGLVAVSGIGTSVLLLVTLTTQTERVPARENAVAESQAVPDSPNPTQSRRLQVAGQPGYAVVINIDGSSYLEEPGGKRTELTGPTQAEDDAVRAATKKLEQVQPKKSGLGQLVVTETGIVDVPKGDIITFIGRDKVVTHNADGSSKVYFVNGRVIQQSRGMRSGRTP